MPFLYPLVAGYGFEGSEDKPHFQQQQSTTELTEKHCDNGNKEETCGSSRRTEHIAGDGFRAQAVPRNEVEEQRTTDTYEHPHAEDDLIEEVKRYGICGLLSEKEVQAEQHGYPGKCTEQDSIKPFQINHRQIRHHEVPMTKPHPGVDGTEERGGRQELK